jgi:hypothetical protein
MISGKFSSSNTFTTFAGDRSKGRNGVREEVSDM